MIRRMRLVNFMSHEDTVIELAAGLTVLSGPNNCGKSAVVVALDCALRGVAGDFMIRHGTRETRVSIEFDDGTAVTWSKRRGGGGVWEYDGRTINRVRGNQCPEDLHEFARMPLVQAETGDPFDIHIAEQKSPIFLLNESSGRAATFFAASSDARYLISMQARQRTQVQELKQEQRRIEVHLETCDARLATLAPVDEVDSQVAGCEIEYAAISERSRNADALRESIEALAACELRKVRAAAAAHGYSILSPPPTLEDTAALDRVVINLGKCADESSHADRRATSLRALTGPPILEDETALSELLGELSPVSAAERREARRSLELVEILPAPDLADETTFARSVDAIGGAMDRIERAESNYAAVGKIGPPPAELECDEISRLVDALAQAEARASDAARREAEAFEAAQASEAELHAWAKEHPTCPTCGAPIDEQRLIHGGCCADA